MEKIKTGQVWVKHEDVPAEKMPTWDARRIKAHGEDLMLVENEFKKGDTAPEHEHFHSQITYVVRGEIEVTCDGETKVLREGDSVYFAPHAVHYVIATEDSLLLDIFSPQRDDFLD